MRYIIYRDFFMNSWVIGCITFLIICSVSCVFWYQYDTAKDREVLDDYVEYASQLQNKRKANSNNLENRNSNSFTDDRSSTDKTDISSQPDIFFTAGEEIEKGISPNDSVSPLSTKELEMSDVHVSPNEFGPYPEIPSDYSLRTPIWLKNNNIVPGHAAVPFEIMDRVLIKLWTQGHKNITGASYSPSEGKVYPHYANTAYVNYKEVVLPDGTVYRRVTRIRGGPDIAPFSKQIMRGKTPASIKIVDYDSAGIDPYTFLK